MHLLLYGARLSGVEESFSNNLSALNTRLGGSIVGELDKRFVSVYDHVDFQVRLLSLGVEYYSKSTNNME